MDQNKFINAYVDHAIGMVHENISVILQLKTQLKLSQELMVEKDQIIENLERQLENNKTDTTELNTHRDNAKLWEESYNAMKQKISHMDTLVRQISEMKSMIIEKDDIINNLSTEMSLLKNPPKVILNRKKKNTSSVANTSNLVLGENLIEQKDDF